MEDDNPSIMKVLQICDVPIDYFHIKKYQDNLHCIGIADGLIFDPNKHSPLPLTKSNLDLCCVSENGSFIMFLYVMNSYPVVMYRQSLSDTNVNIYKTMSV